MLFFFFNDTATTEIYTLSLHDALPIFTILVMGGSRRDGVRAVTRNSGPRRDYGLLRQEEPIRRDLPIMAQHRSEEHTSELQSRQYLVCRLLLEKKKSIHANIPYSVLIY